MMSEMKLGAAYKLWSVVGRGGEIEKADAEAALASYEAALRAGGTARNRHGYFTRADTMRHFLKYGWAS